RQPGITCVHGTESQTEAMSVADPVVLLTAGRIEQDAAPAELYARAATLFAARFIGTPPMNIVAAPGREDLKLGVRPEHVRIADAGRIAAPVLSAESFAADTIGTSPAGGDTTAARVAGRHDLAPGAPVSLAW